MGENSINCALSIPNTLNLRGINYEDYQKNPVVLWMFFNDPANQYDKKFPRLRSSRRLPIGRCDKIEIGEKVMVQLTFSEYLGPELLQAYDTGHLKFDIGFVPLRTHKDDQGRNIFDKVELIEISAFFDTREEPA